MSRAVLSGSLAALIGLGIPHASARQQQQQQQQQEPEQAADAGYDTTVAAPAYTSEHPAVLFDEAHHNFHTTGGRYKPFADLIAHDGYRIEANKRPIARPVLDGHRILIIANAAGAEGKGLHASDPALTDAECRAVESWVKAGGALLLITDIRQWGAASRRLGLRFGVDMSQGLTIDRQNSVPRRPARLVFSRENGLLGDHPILRGRGESERVSTVVTYAGQSLMGPRGCTPLLPFGETAIDRYEDGGIMVRAVGRCQGLALTHGKGRVVVLGEAGALSAQFDDGGQPLGMNDPGNDNRQLALNIMHWLSGLILPDSRTADGRTAPSPPRPTPQPGP